MKAHKDFKSTGKACANPKYDGITKVVPADQCKQINRSDVVDSVYSANKSGVHSDPITMEDLNALTEQAKQSHEAQTTGEKPVKIQEVERKRSEIKQFQKKSRDTVIEKTKQGCKTAAKAAAIAAGLAALTSLASSTYKLYPQYKRGDISLSTAVWEAFTDLTSSAATAGGTGALMGIVELLCEHNAPKVVDKLGLGMAAFMWLFQVAVHVKQWWEKDISASELAGRILQTTVSMGAGGGGGFLGSMAGMSLCGPLGAIIGGFLGGMLAGFCVDYHNTFVPLRAWVTSTRPTDNLLRDLDYDNGHWWVKGKADEILSVLEGQGPWGWLKSEPTQQDVSRLVRELGSHFRRVALKYHPDRAALRGDTPAQRTDNIAKLKTAKNAYEQLVQLLNDQLVASQRFEAAMLCRPVLMLPEPDAQP
ncbi:unnamed protein product [Symbiodinium sp. CCMP2592]|nr:unnamed protein product [Symbiodinium sp. CCMP2592]